MAFELPFNDRIYFENDQCSWIILILSLALENTRKTVKFEYYVDCFYTYVRRLEFDLTRICSLSGYQISSPPRAMCISYYFSKHIY